MADNSIELLCIGNALVDVFASTDERFFVRHGLAEPVQHIEIEKLKEMISDLPAFTALSGGGAANVAKIAGSLGLKVSFTGAVGDDEFGRLFKENLAAAAVKPNLLTKPSPTGICLMLKNGSGGTGGETRIAASPSAALELKESDINAEELRKARIVMIDGFILNRPPLVSHIFRLLEQSGTAAAIDLASTGIAREYAAEIAGLVKRFPLILFMNEAEAEAFSGGLKSSMQQETLFENNTDSLTVVVKLGQDGAICHSKGKMIRAKTQAVTPVDATGAGDAFCAGFLAAWIRNKPPGECAEFGNMAAATVLGAYGCRADEKALKSLAAQLGKQ